MKLTPCTLTLPLNMVHNHSGNEEPMPTLTDIYNLPLMASGEKTKARDILAAIRTLTQIEAAQRPASPDERQILGRFSGFGGVALSLFPNPVTGRYKDETWRELGEELRAVLSPEEYDSAKRTTFTAFYTSPTVMRPSWSRVAAPAISSALPPLPCALSASSWTGCPGASPARSIPVTTSESKTSAIPACLRAASTP
jgi:hypothetical protein